MTQNVGYVSFCNKHGFAGSCLFVATMVGMGLSSIPLLAVGKPVASGLLAVGQGSVWIAHYMIEKHTPPWLAARNYPKREGSEIYQRRQVRIIGGLLAAFSAAAAIACAVEKPEAPKPAASATKTVQILHNNFR